MERIVDSVGWPTRDPRWVSKVVLMGVISLIPVVGAMALLGWMLGALDNLRAGRQELPPAGFELLGRGLNLFVVLLVYGLAASVLVGLVLVTAVLIAGMGSSSSGASALGGLVFLIGWAMLLAAVLGFHVLMPPIVVATERGGIRGGLDVPQVLGLATTDPRYSLLAGLMALVAYALGGVGAIFCGIGVLLTVAYGHAVLAGVVSSFESNLAAPGGSPAAPGGSPTAPAV